MSIAEIATLLFAFGAFVGVVITIREVFWKSKKIEASTADQFEQILSRTIANFEKELALTKKYREKIDQLEEELEELRKVVDEWDKGIRALICQLEKNKLSPTWRPQRQYKRKSVET